MKRFDVTLCFCVDLRAIFHFHVQFFCTISTRIYSSSTASEQAMSFGGGEVHFREAYAVVETVILKWTRSSHPTHNVLLVIQSQFLYVLQVHHVPLATGIPNIVTTPHAPFALSNWLPFSPRTSGYPTMWRVEMLWVSGDFDVEFAKGMLRCTILFMSEMFVG